MTSLGFPDSFNDDIAGIIAEYLIEDIPYKLRDWINPELVDWGVACQFPESIDELQSHINDIDIVNFRKNPKGGKLLEEFIDYSNWRCILENPGMIHVIKKYLHKMQRSDWWLLCGNTNAGSIIEQNLKHAHWDRVSANEGMMSVIKKNMHLVCMKNLCKNRNKEAVAIVAANLNHKDIDWDAIMMNPEALSIIIVNMNRINPRLLCANHAAGFILATFTLDQLDLGKLAFNPSAGSIIEQHFDKFPFYLLELNRGIIHLLEQHKDKIRKYFFSMNPAIFEINMVKYKIMIAKFVKIIQSL